MGYETTLVIVDDWQNNRKGYKSVVAQLDLCKVAYDNFGELIDIKRKENEDYLKANPRVKDWLVEYRELRDKLNREDDEFYNEHKKEFKKLWTLERFIAKHLPYSYIEDGNKSTFYDNYGSLLMKASLKEVYEAALKDKVKELEGRAAGWSTKGEYYWRWDLALGLLESFMKQDNSEKRFLVYLYGN